MGIVNPEPTPRVVLVRDGRWPDVPGVCCWRHAVREAFTAAGATVAETSWQPPAGPPAPMPAPPGTPQPPPRQGQPARLAWLPGVVRRPMVVAYRRGRAVRQRAREQASRQALRAALPDVGSAHLVVAESLDYALAAVAAGTPPRTVWALALPAERLVAGAPSDDAPRLAAAARAVGGLLTDSEPAREAVERAAADSRPRVEIFPPLAYDRPCPSCAAAGRTEAEAAPGPVAQLARWRRLLDRTDADVPYSFPVARLLGPAARWAPAQRPDWRQDTPTSPLRGPAGGPAPDWSAARQDRAARAVLDAVVPHPPRRARPARAALVSGFDLKFVQDLAERLDNRTDLDVTLDPWPYIGHRSPLTDARADAAGSILAEWARPSAAWLAGRKKPGQFLVVRLHRFELDTPYPAQIDIDKVDAVVHVSPPIGRRIENELGWPREKLVYIPNFLDVDWVDRPKLADARFGIGFVGMEWANKRFDLALDILAEVRRQDRRFTLFVRSVLPWNNKYAWPKAEEREYVGWCLDRIEHDPLLRGAVQFDAPGRDMARWYRRVGAVLSMSDVESFHLAAAEGMASGAVPVIRPWPGAREIYGKEWIHESVTDAAADVLTNADAEVWAERAARARAEIREKVDPAAVVEAWADLLHGDLRSARHHFAPFTAPALPAPPPSPPPPPPPSPSIKGEST